MQKHWNRLASGARGLLPFVEGMVVGLAICGVVALLLAPIGLSLTTENFWYLSLYGVYAAILAYVDGWMEER